MAYSLYRLEFTTGLHVGTDTGGKSLDSGQMTIHSDTIFSALCCECARKGNIDQLYNYFADGDITISDALPYSGNEYFIPRPMLYLQGFKHEGRPEMKKALKSLEFIPVSAFDAYIDGITKGSDFDPELMKGNFGSLSSYTKVSMRDGPQPYEVAYWKFARDTGLYIIVEYNSSDSLDIFEKALFSLGQSGIGGKQSSGLGKFNIKKETLPQKLEELLRDSEVKYQMLLGTALPRDEELDEVLSDGWYMVLRRGGFVRSENYSQTQRKKKTIYMLSPGSCLKRRFKGEIFDLSDGGFHPVWRNGKTLFAGVRI